MERQFVEVIIAPKVSAEAQEVVKRKKNVRLLECGEWTSRSERLDFKRVNGRFVSTRCRFRHGWRG